MNSPEIVILQALLEKETGFVSGSTLARALGMSRVAVWQHMEKLREQGFLFEAVRARGYKLTSRPPTLSRPLVEAYLAIRKLPHDVAFYSEIDSTNDEAVRLLAAGRTPPFVVLTQRQTRGRGRFGRSWHSDPTGNLAISFALRPEVEPARMQTFTLWMGANICELIANFTRTSPGLKWPNDILFDGRKAGGMLTEARIDADQIRDLVFGLGLNINSAATAWPEAVAHRAISLSEHTKGPVDLNKFTAALIGRVYASYDQFISGEYRKTLAERWHLYDVLRGKSVTLLQGSRQVEGIAAGIDDEGSLILKLDRGRTERFRAGEVSLGKKASA